MSGKSRSPSVTAPWQKACRIKCLLKTRPAVRLPVPINFLIFRNRGANAVPVVHPNGLTEYIGERHVPHELLQYRDWSGSQLENKYSHWVWRQYASAFWDDIRIDRVLPYRQSKEEDDERHVHPLQLDVIERGVTLWSNPGEVVLTPFMGVGSEVYGALTMGRRGIGIELKAAYFRQAVKNVAEVRRRDMHQQDMFPETPALILS